MVCNAGGSCSGHQTLLTPAARIVQPTLDDDWMGPWLLQQRQCWTGDHSMFFKIHDLFFQETFTIELWFKFKDTKRTLFSSRFRVNETDDADQYHMDLWITHCHGIGLDWAYEHYHTGKNAMS
jgi:hypothetical protein